jgi:hypothetical protein
MTVWYDSARAGGLPDGQEESAARALRQIIAASCLLGASTAAQACDLAERVPGVTQSPRLAEWLEDVAAAGHRDPGQDGFLSLTRLAELHTLRELTSSAEFTLCVPRIPSTSLTSRVALPAFRP